LVKAEENKSKENKKSTLLVGVEYNRIANLKTLFGPFTILATNLGDLMQKYINEIDHAVSSEGAESESLFIDRYNRYITELTDFFGQKSFKDVYITYANKYEQNMFDNVDCANLLILPIQRLPRYIIFMDDFIKTSTQMKTIAQPIDNLLTL
jgi:hypothetical protein